MLVCASLLGALGCDGGPVEPPLGDSGPAVGIARTAQINAYEGQPRFVTVLDSGTGESLEGATVMADDVFRIVAQRCAGTRCGVVLEVRDTRPNTGAAVPQPIDAQGHFLTVRPADGPDLRALVNVLPLDTISAGGGEPVRTGGVRLASGMNVTAGAMVIGANLGTTSTAAFAAVGATSAAKRTAVGHVAFNLLAAVVALALLPWLLDAMLLLLGDQTPLPTLLALFHTVFNLLGVLLMWPLSGRLRVWLERRFVSEDEKKGEPRHLDANVLSVPALAIESLTLEMRRAGRHAGEIVGLALRAPAADRAVVERRIERFHHLMDAIGEGFSALDRAQLSDATAGTLALLIRTSRHYYTAVEQAAALLTLREADTTRAARFDGPLGEALHRVITLANPEREGFRLSDADEALGVLEERYQHDRKSLIAAATRGEASAGPSMTSYHLLAEARRAVRHLVRAAEDLPLSDSRVA